MIPILNILAKPIYTFLKGVNLQRVLACLLTTLVLVSTLAPVSAMADQTDKRLQHEVSDILDDEDSNRPKTTREWKAEARETADQPGERAKRIIEETGDALQDWAELYPDVAERSVPALQDN